MSSNPTITATVRDVNSDTIALTGDSSVLIRYRSNAQATMTATAYGESVINQDMYIIRNGSDTVYGHTGTFEGVESEVFRFSAEDSKGRVGTATVTVEMIPYIELTCYMTGNKPDANGNMRVECSGDYFNGHFGAKANFLTAKYRYKKSGGSFSGWYGMTVSIGESTYTAYADLSGLDYRASYSFEVQVEDRLTIAGGSGAGVSSLPIFHWGADDFAFEVPVYAGDMYLNKGGTHGNYLRFGDGNFCYIAEKTDDDMTIHADTINLETDELQLNGNNITLDSGEWTPELYDEAVRTYDDQLGWYSRVGNVVTVGFFIKALCWSGYDDTEIVIYGLPYEPSVRASGGGICSNTYTVNGYTFQCYVAEEGTREITVRVHECDREYDGNLTTSASGCYYPDGSETITLSGTITYVI